MQEILIQGNPTPIHFGLRAINEFTRQRNADFEQTVTTTDALSSLDSIVSLTVMGLNEGARQMHQDSRYTEDDVWGFFEEEPDLILTVSELFVEAITPLTEKLGNISKNVRPTAPKRKNRKKRRRNK